DCGRPEWTSGGTTSINENRAENSPCRPTRLSGNNIGLRMTTLRAHGSFHQLVRTLNTPVSIAGFTLQPGKEHPTPETSDPSPLRIKRPGSSLRTAGVVEPVSGENWRNW